MAELLRFWLVALLVAGLALPLAFQLFRRFPDAGAGLAFPLGLVVTAFGFFLLRVADVLPAGPGGAVLAVLLLGSVSATVAARDRRFLSTLRRAGPQIIAMAGLFSILFLACAAFRSYVPDITGTEQPMDFMYLNAVIEAESYPPPDPWFAGERLSYYYLGYVQIGVLTMASGVPAEVGYNLGLAFTFAAAGTAVASVALAGARWVLGRRPQQWPLLAAGAAVAFLLFAGSLSSWFHLASAHGAYDEGIYRAFGTQAFGPCSELSPELREEADCHMGTDSWYPDKFWWWFTTTRVIPGTITEFPAFSFLLGDLHPHVTALPLIILATALAAATWRGRRLLDYRDHLRRPGITLLLAALLGVTAFQNAWDAVAFPLLFAAAVLARNLRAAARPVDALVASAAYFAPLALLAGILLVPWYLDFSSQAGGLHAYTGAGTTPGQLFVQWGPLLLAAPLVLVAALRRPEVRDSALLAAPFTLGLAALPMVVWAVLAARDAGLGNAVDARGGWGWFTLAVLGVMVWALGSASVALIWQRRASGLVAGAATMGVLLLYGAELLLIKDIFFGGAPRLNTIFKLSYEAWVLLSIAGGIGLAAAASRAARHRAELFALVPAVAIGAASLLFLVIAIPERTNGLSNSTTLHGLDFARARDAGEYALLQWVQTNVPPGAVVAEAPGRGYSDSSRLSGRSGRLTVLGWRGHEFQWRGADPALDAMLQQRESMLDAAYQAGADPAPLAALVAAFDVQYVVVGSIELGRYPSDIMTDFPRFLDLVYETGAYRIYRVPVMAVVPTS